MQHEASFYAQARVPISSVWFWRVPKDLLVPCEVGIDYQDHLEVVLKLPIAPCNRSRYHLQLLISSRRTAVSGLTDGFEYFLILPLSVSLSFSIPQRSFKMLSSLPRVALSGFIPC